jgi:hypothetical protein
MHIEIDILMSTYVIITTVDLGLQKKKIYGLERKDYFSC